MDKLDEDATLGQMKTLLSETRSRLSEAVQEAAEVGVWDGDDEEDCEAGRPGGSITADLPPEAAPDCIGTLSGREKETALKRAKNREAARRSRRRKSERLHQLSKDVKTLQQENLLLLKCIEEFTQKAIACKEEQLIMQKELESLTNQAELKTPQARLPSSMASLCLPSLEELRRLTNTETGAFTARDGSGSQTSARKTALAEHQAHLSSKENSPRDDEECGYDSGGRMKSHPPHLLAISIKGPTDSL